MRIATSRFGTVEVSAADVIHFAAGLPGLEGGADWVLLADAENDVLGWLRNWGGGLVTTCGLDHALMRFTLKVVSRDDFDKWVSEQKVTQPSVQQPR